MNKTCVVALLFLIGCGSERYAGGPEEGKASAMMDCRHSVWVERGGPEKAFLAGFGGAVGGAAGGAVMGAAAGERYPVKFSDAVDQCMAAKGYPALYANPWDHH